MALSIPKLSQQRPSQRAPGQGHFQGLGTAGSKLNRCQQVSRSSFGQCVHHQPLPEIPRTPHPNLLLPPCLSCCSPSNVLWARARTRSEPESLGEAGSQWPVHMVYQREGLTEGNVQVSKPNTERQDGPLHALLLGLRYNVLVSTMI